MSENKLKSFIFRTGYALYGMTILPHALHVLTLKAVFDREVKDKTDEELKGYIDRDELTNLTTRSWISLLTALLGTFAQLYRGEPGVTTGMLTRGTAIALQSYHLATFTAINTYLDKLNKAMSNQGKLNCLVRLQVQDEMKYVNGVVYGLNGFMILVNTAHFVGYVAKASKGIKVKKKKKKKEEENKADKKKEEQNKSSFFFSFWQNKADKKEEEGAPQSEVELQPIPQQNLDLNPEE